MRRFIGLSPCLLALHCSPSSDVEPGDTDDSDANADTDTDTDTGPAPTPISVSGIISNFGGAPLEGVVVAIKGEKITATTDATGAYSLDSVPGGRPQLMTWEHDDYVPTAFTLNAGADDIELDAIMIVPFEAILNAGIVLVTLDLENHGMIGFAARSEPGDDNGLAGVTVSVTPNDAEGPFYVAESGIPSADLTTTQAGEGQGAGTILNVPPGDHQLSYSGSASGCEPDDLGWSAGTDTVTVPVSAGWFVITAMSCE